MSHCASSLQFLALSARHVESLVAMLKLLSGDGEDKYFHPHPFSEDYFSHLLSSTYTDFYSVATWGEKVVAYGILRGWDEGYDVPSLGIAVHPEYRRIGLSSALMSYLHLTARLHGAKTIRLKVYLDNVAAINLYRRAGYQFEVFNDQELLGMYSFPLFQ